MKLPFIHTYMDDVYISCLYFLYENNMYFCYNTCHYENVLEYRILIEIMTQNNTCIIVDSWCFFHCLGFFYEKANTKFFFICKDHTQIADHVSKLIYRNVKYKIWKTTSTLILKRKKSLVFQKGCDADLYQPPDMQYL